MRLYCPELVPGLLQTEDYARAVIRAVRPGYDEDSVERRVTARLTRQKVLLDRAPPPALELVLNEAVLRRLVGREQVMAAQLRALARRRAAPVGHAPGAPVQRGRARQPGRRIRPHRVPGGNRPDVVYVEGIMGDLYLESVEEVKRYQSAFERNQAVALAPEESSAFLSALARELS